MTNRKKITVILVLFFSIIGLGVIGYRSLLHVTFIDALYMTVITISTVGYGEIQPLSDTGKLFSMILIFLGLITVGYGFTSLITIIFDGNLKEAWRQKKMKDKIKQLEDHYIICGAGKVGQTVIHTFLENNLDFVVIESNEKIVADLSEDNILCILGDATLEDTLEEARIHTAKGVVSVLANDSDNVFTVLTVREMSEDIYIVARSIEHNSDKKLLKAGANKTISPNELGGRRIASHILRPTVMSFLDVITQVDDITLDLEEVTVRPESHLADLTLAEAKIPNHTGLIILAVKRAGTKKLIFNPGSFEILQPNDIMIVLGTPEQVQKLNQLMAD